MCIGALCTVTRVVCAITLPPRLRSPAPEGTVGDEMSTAFLVMRVKMLYLHQRRGRVDEVLLPLRLGTLLVPVYDSLIGDAVLIVQNLRRVRTLC